MARAVGDLGVPILGVNLGGLGFLTATTLDEMLPALEAVRVGGMAIEERMMLGARLIRSGQTVGEYMRAQRRGHHQVGDEPHRGSVRVRRRPSRHRLPGRRPHHLDADRLHRLQPVDRRPHPVSHDGRGGADPHRAAHAEQPPDRASRLPSGSRSPCSTIRTSCSRWTARSACRCASATRSKCGRPRRAHSPAALPAEGLLLGAAHEAQVGRAVTSRSLAPIRIPLEPARGVA